MDPAPAGASHDGFRFGGRESESRLSRPPAGLVSGGRWDPDTPRLLVRPELPRRDTGEGLRQRDGLSCCGPSRTPDAGGLALV